LGQAQKNIGKERKEGREAGRIEERKNGKEGQREERRIDTETRTLVSIPSVRTRPLCRSGRQSSVAW
jgi:hypothetical protein